MQSDNFMNLHSISLIQTLVSHLFQHRHKHVDFNLVLMNLNLFPCDKRGFQEKGHVRAFPILIRFLLRVDMRPEDINI
jgi:hypothetical protein